MKEKKKFQLSSDVMRIILIVLGSVFSTLVLVFAVFAIMELQQDNQEKASLYLLGIFITLGLSRLVTFLRERNKISLFSFSFLINI